MAGDAPLGFSVVDSNSVKLESLNHGISLMDPDFALTHSYKYEMTTAEFIKANVWLLVLVLLLLAIVVVSFVIRGLYKSKLYLANELKQKAETIASETVIRSLSSIYFATLEIDVRTEKMHIFRIPDYMKEQFPVDGLSFAQVKDRYIDMCVDSNYQESVREFLDYGTLSKRLKEHGFLQKNYFGKKNGWCRITLISVINSETGNMEKLYLPWQISTKRKIVKNASCTRRNTTN